MAVLYGNNYYNEQASGFQTVNAIADDTGVNTYTKGASTLSYQLNLFGSWIGSG
jgi:hypothetical protein